GGSDRRLLRHVVAASDRARHPRRSSVTLGNDKSLTHGDSRRDESPTKQLDRNWAELLQELRVAQTGVQLLTGFLLTLPFQQRFEHLTRAQQHLYLGIVLLS